MDNKTFDYYGTGVVVDDLDPAKSTGYISIYMAEIVPETDLSSDKKNTENKDNVDIFGKHTSIAGGEHDTITARWLPDTAHSLYPPLVVKGEVVKVYRSGNGDTFFWDVFLNDFPSRKRDQLMVFLPNNKASVREKTTEIKTGYYFYFSSLVKLVQLFTSTNDGEKVGYDFKIDTKNGIVKLIDTVRNSFNLSSVRGILDVVITSTINITTSIVNISAKKSYTVKTTDDTRQSNKYTNTTSSYVSNSDSFTVKTSQLNVTSKGEDLVTLMNDILTTLENFKNIDSIGGQTHVDPGTKQEITAQKTRLSKFK